MTRPLELHSGDARAVLVTGAAGFLGSHLCDRLLERGHRVIGLDNLSTGDIAHVAHLQGEPRFRFIRHDITRDLPPDVRGIGHVFNLACPPSPSYYQQHPVDTVLASTLGTWRLLELARQEGARLLQASTSEVYGDPQVHPQPESYWGHANPFGPRACYDEGKRCAEAMCLAWRTQHGLDVRIARLFNSYGPRLRAGDGRVVSNFIVQALAGRPLTVYGDGAQTRSFCYVGDTVEGLLKLMDSDATEPVNLGNPDEFTVLQLAGRIRQLTGSASPVQFLPLPKDDPVRRRPDITRARAVLNWSPAVSLDDGLRWTIDYFKRIDVETGSDKAAATPSVIPPTMTATRPTLSERPR